MKSYKPDIIAIIAKAKRGIISLSLRPIVVDGTTVIAATLRGSSIFVIDKMGFEVPMEENDYNLKQIFLQILHRHE